MDIDAFKKIILSHYKTAGREFPWRGVDPWGVMVSEFMLQQTQTGRVIPYWERWMKLWPSPELLAAAPMETVLREWSGLGYNRRCYFLKNSAAIIARDCGGQVPDTPGTLLPLPGVGPYIAGAIACFAYNYPSVFIETNIRSTVIHFFFPDRKDVQDAEIIPILESAVDHADPRTWYYALMDYGAALKKLVPNPNRRSAHYAKQSPFEGSFRQARGTVLRTLIAIGPGTAQDIQTASGLEKTDLYKVLDAMKKESQVAEEGGIYRIQDRT
ncbi:MAG: A/G-specific adenine glycosylase [Treponema sp.]|jgi:A/G-specific adenine glycosylase|nr:A/G-specific adenine glycosylase [Treponema sp.]